MIINFEKISWQQILTLIRVINSCPSLNLKTVTRWYNSESTNFEDTLKFLKNIRVVKLKGDKIIPREALNHTIGLNNESIKQFFIDTLFRKRNYLSKYLAAFFDNFELINGYYKFVPTTKERLKYSGIRNFLIDLGVLKFESQFNGYSLKPELIGSFSYKKKALTYHQLERRLRLEKELGYTAEVQVYLYEKSKFKNNSDIQKKIKHISLENVLAGYDISSFEILKDKKPNPKYIEVKAVSDNDWKFYWSKNEISQAKQLGKNYYLYLIPVKNGEISKSSAWCQISDPYGEIFLNKQKWEQTVEIVSFVLTNL